MVLLKPHHRKIKIFETPKWGFLEIFEEPYWVFSSNPQDCSRFQKDIDGKDVSLKKFKGKSPLIVNVASRCGLTSSNYSKLSHLYEKYKNQGFEILVFPCNQFGSQEPGSNPEEIKQFACTLDSKPSFLYSIIKKPMAEINWLRNL